jgi:hypothetical protein
MNCASFAFFAPVAEHALHSPPEQLARLKSRDFYSGIRASAPSLRLPEGCSGGYSLANGKARED